MIKDGEYLFASSYLRASEKTGTAAERLNRFADSTSIGTLCMNASQAFGIKNTELPEAVFKAAMAEAVLKVREAVPDFSVYKPLLYKYDCTNVKLAIKCAIRGIDPLDMMFTSSTVEPAKIVAAAADGDFSCLPQEMSTAALQARETYLKTGEARAIDLILDRACFADMSREAKQGGVRLIMDIVTMRADTVNIMSALRIKASGVSAETAKSLFERAFVPGGDISHDDFISSDGVRSLAEISAYSVKSPINGAVKLALSKSDISFTELERIFDEAVLFLVADVKYKSFGPEIAVRYLIVREAEVMNCRIVAMGIMSGIVGDDLRERMRRAYV